MGPLTATVTQKHILASLSCDFLQAQTPALSVTPSEDTIVRNSVIRAEPGRAGAFVKAIPEIRRSPGGGNPGTTPIDFNGARFHPAGAALWENEIDHACVLA